MARSLAAAAAAAPLSPAPPLAAAAVSLLLAGIRAPPSRRIHAPPPHPGSMPSPPSPDDSWALTCMHACVPTQELQQGTPPFQLRSEFMAAFESKAKEFRRLVQVGLPA